MELKYGHVVVKEAIRLIQLLLFVRKIAQLGSITIQLIMIVLTALLMLILVIKMDKFYHVSIDIHLMNLQISVIDATLDNLMIHLHFHAFLVLIMSHAAILLPEFLTIYVVVILVIL